MAFIKPAALAALALASALTLAPMAAHAYDSADGERAQRAQAQCEAAKEVSDSIGVSVYCASAAEAWSLFLSGVHKTELWAVMRSMEANDLFQAANSENARDERLSKLHVIAALAIMNDVMDRFPTAARKEFRHDLHMIVVRIIEIDAGRK